MIYFLHNTATNRELGAGQYIPNIELEYLMDLDVGELKILQIVIARQTTFLIRL